MASKKKPISDAGALFPPRDQTIKAIADRAQARSDATKAMLEKAPRASIDVKSLPLPTTSDEYFAHASAWISGSSDIKTARDRWTAEQPLRKTVKLSEKQTRLLVAGLDGRCARLKGV